MNELYHFEENTSDVDFMSSSDEAVSHINASTAQNSMDSVVQPIAIEGAQLSRNGTDEEQDRRLLAPTPPLILSYYNLKMETFVSPTTLQEQSFLCKAPSSAAIATTVYQTEHRQVTPMPVGELSPVPSLNMTSNSSSMYVASSNGCFDAAANPTMLKNKDAALVITSKAKSDDELSDCAYFPYRDYLYNKSTLFPLIFHRMVSETSNEQRTSAMYWTECGENFWIDQHHPMLSDTIAKYFKHNRYQSLRRQLNAYGFGKYQSGNKKGYWMHPIFCRECSVETLKSINAPRGKTRSKKKKIVSRRTNSSTTRGASLSKVTDKGQSSNAPVESTSSSKKITIKKHLNCAQAKGATDRGNACLYQPEASCGTQVDAGDRHTDSMSAGDAKYLPLEDPFLSEPILDFSNEIPSFYDDASNNALTALATVASFLPGVPTPLYTPISKDSDVVEPFLVKEIAPRMKTTSPQDVKMTILADAANCFLPTPIKAPVSSTNTDCDHTFWSESIDCCLDDAISTYSVGSLSSPMNLIFPTNDRSAFTPVISSIDQMVAEFCASFD